MGGAGIHRRSPLVGGICCYAGWACPRAQTFLALGLNLRSALAAVPLRVGDNRLGALGVNFTEPQVFDEEEKDFLLVLTRQCAQALELALLYEALQESETQRRLALEATRLGEHGDALELSVHNEGAPIPADRLPRLFEPMQRATSLDDKTGRSVGLGLYIVKHIVEAHRGTITVRSRQDAGTRFTVRLPRHGKKLEPSHA
jgi:K+-sensing histidine kinase KdpD